MLARLGGCPTRYPADMLSRFTVLAPAARVVENQRHHQHEIFKSSHGLQAPLPIRVTRRTTLKLEVGACSDSHDLQRDLGIGWCMYFCSCLWWLFPRVFFSFCNAHAMPGMDESPEKSELRNDKVQIQAPKSCHNRVLQHGPMDVT